jgi:UDP-N-acetylmuramoylalanine--D-glutamate ligase
LYDANEEAKVEFAKEGEPVYLGKFPEELFVAMDYMVLSPGISIFTDYVEKAKQKGIKVIGEIELAYLISKGRIAAITGTNGKTTNNSTDRKDS